MKSLLDIQQDIRNLQTDIKKITQCIANINSDIEEIRNVDQNKNFDYSKIAVLAKQLPFGKHPLDKQENGRICQLYIELLLNIIWLDYEAETTVNRLVFIQWLQMQSKIDWSLEDLLADSHKMHSDLYDEFVQAIPRKYADDFILDALIVANMGGPANKEVLEYLAGLSSILGIDAEKLRILSFVAIIVLCQNFVKMEREDAEKVLQQAKRYKHYIGSEILSEAVQTQREIVVQLPDHEIRDFKWEVAQKQKVKKGEIIATYSGSVEVGLWSPSGKKKKKVAPSAGTIFQFKNNCINYGVLSLEADNKDSIKAWIKAGGRKT